MSNTTTAQKMSFAQALEDQTAAVNGLIKLLREVGVLKLAVEHGVCENSLQMEDMIRHAMSNPLALLSDKKGTGNKLQRLTPSSERPFSHTPKSYKLWKFLSGVGVYDDYLGKVKNHKNFILTNDSITCRKDVKLMFTLLKYLDLCESDEQCEQIVFSEPRVYKRTVKNPKKIVVDVEAYYELFSPDSYKEYRSEGNRSKSFYTAAINEICPTPVKKRATKAKTTGPSAGKVVLVENSPQQLTKDVKGEGKEIIPVETPDFPSPVVDKVQEESSSVEKPHEPSTEESDVNSPVPGPSVSEKRQQVQETYVSKPDLLASVDEVKEEKPIDIFLGIKRRYLKMKEKHSLLGMNIVDPNQFGYGADRHTLGYLEKTLDEWRLCGLERTYPYNERIFIKHMGLASRSLNYEDGWRWKDAGPEEYKERREEVHRLDPRTKEVGHICDLYRLEDDALRFIRGRKFKEDEIKAWDEDLFRSKLSSIDQKYDDK